MMISSAPFGTILPHTSKVLYNCTIQDSFDIFKHHVNATRGVTDLDTITEWYVQHTRFLVGKLYTLREIIAAGDKPAPPFDGAATVNKCQRRCAALPKTRLMKKLLRFNAQKSVDDSLQDQVYYLVAWLKGLQRNTAAYNAAVPKRDWRLLPVYHRSNKRDWALLAWHPDQRVPTLYTTSTDKDAEYESAIDPLVVLDADFFRVEQPLVKRHVAPRRKLLKIMQVAYNLHARDKLLTDLDVVAVFTSIVHAEPHFIGSSGDGSSSSATFYVEPTNLTGFDKILNDKGRLCQ